MSGGYRNNTLVSRIFESIRPNGGINTSQKLLDILRPYSRGIECRGVDDIKPLNLIVITNSAPSDDVDSVIKME